MYDVLFNAYVEAIYGGKAGLSFFGKLILAVMSILCVLCLSSLFGGHKVWSAIFSVSYIIMMILLMVLCFRGGGNYGYRKYITLPSEQGYVRLRRPAEDRKMVALKQALEKCVPGKSFIMEPDTVNLLIEMTEKRKGARDLTGKLGLGSIGAMLISVVVAFVSSLLSMMDDSDLSDHTLNLFFLLIVLIAVVMGAIVFLYSKVQEFLNRDYDSFLKALYDYKICLGLDKSVLEMDGN